MKPPLAEEVEICSNQAGVVVPIPRAPLKKEEEVVVEIRDPTVSCEVVEMRAVPAELTVTMVFGDQVEALVPPLASGSVPVTSVPKAT